MVERIITGPLHTNTYVFATGRKSCILIDPGHDAEEIWKSMERINMIPHTIVFTHGHIDHTAGAKAILEHYSEKDCEVRVGIHKSDLAYLEDSDGSLNRTFLPPDNSEADEVFAELFTELPAVDFTLEEGDSLPESDLSVIHIPGHTEGSIFLYSESSSTLFSGDTLFFDGLGRTDIQGGNSELMLELLKEKIFSLPPDTRIYPGHGPLTTLEREIREDSFKTDHGMI